MADFAFLNSPKLISRKIWMTEKSWNFHCFQLWFILWQTNFLFLADFWWIAKIRISFSCPTLCSLWRRSCWWANARSWPWMPSPGCHSWSSCWHVGKRQSFLGILQVRTFFFFHFFLKKIYFNFFLQVRSFIKNSVFPTSLYGIFRIFVSLRFYVKSILRILQVQNLPF